MWCRRCPLIIRPGSLAPRNRCTAARAAADISESADRSLTDCTARSGRRGATRRDDRGSTDYTIPPESRIRRHVIRASRSQDTALEALRHGADVKDLRMPLGPVVIEGATFGVWKRIPLAPLTDAASTVAIVGLRWRRRAARVTARGQAELLVCAGAQLDFKIVTPRRKFVRIDGMHIFSDRADNTSGFNGGDHVES
jgi:hypothetical protein